MALHRGALVSPETMDSLASLGPLGVACGSLVGLCPMAKVLGESRERHIEGSVDKH